MLKHAEFTAHFQQLLDEMRIADGGTKAGPLTIAQIEHTKKIAGNHTEALDLIRLSIKYLGFDLQATRNERDYLRKQLERTGGGK